MFAGFRLLLAKFLHIFRPYATQFSDFPVTPTQYCNFCRFYLSLDNSDSRARIDSFDIYSYLMVQIIY